MSDLKENRYIAQGNEYNYFIKLIDVAKKGKTKGILLVGPPGTGKTLLALTAARDLDAEYFTIDGNEEVDRLQIEGHWKIEGGETIFVPGPLVNAILSANRNGIAFLIINEINAIRESQQIGLNGAFSEGEVNVISKSSERYSLNKDAKLIIVGTMNEDVLGIRELQEALDDRFDNQIPISYPNKKKEIEIITEITQCNPDLADLVCEMASQMRDMARTDLELSKLFTTRMGVNFCYVVDQMGQEFIEENLLTMIKAKMAKETSEESAIDRLLSGLDMSNRIKAIYAPSKKEVVEIEEEEIEAWEGEIEEEVVDKSINTVMAKIISSECISKGMSVVRGGKMTYQTLQYIWDNHREKTQEYFGQATDKIDEYQRETSKDPYYGGSLTMTFIYWFYKDRSSEFNEFVFTIQPIISF